MAMKEIAKNTRAVEVAGLAVSLVALAVSLFIFSYFRSLKCSRTKIHVNLFSAMLIQVLCRLVLYIDQYVARLVAGEIAGAAAGTSGTISDTRVVCEALYILMEYTWTVMFMWMFIEGLYLHNQITVSVFSDGPNFKLYHCIGWGVPLIITIPWVITVAVTLPPTEGCWLGIEFLTTYWIIQGPRLVIFAIINLTFLVIIISVLVNKLKESRSSEAEQVRKAVKAAILLLPLLGITNIMGMVKPPSDTVVAYGVYSYTSHILSSFQGFLVALFYCFLNGEVRQALSKHWDRYWQRKGQYRRTSRSQSLYTSETEVQSTFPGKGFVKIQLAKSTQKSKLNNGVHVQDKTSGSSCEPDTTTL
ncbi:PDF receptor [Lingula anatina]|uniref:PDF receptor n=1 Tax=Lingula anatina TaxID=7574 RepID=A0A1S3K6D4_LINAN|nr:PDF receptor [Lingula anatina]|eukprot:XP_013418190.1 PDF receptor [Lingula anatina]